MGRRVVSRTLVAVLGVLALLTAGCGGSDEQAPDPSPAAAEQAAKIVPATTFETISHAPIDPDRHGKTEGEVIHPEQELTVYDAVDGAPIANLPVEQINSPTWVPVIARQGDWAQILLPTRPNGASGWVNTAGGVTETAQNHYRITVDLSDFSLTVFRKGEQTNQFTIGIGKPEHPTPTGRAFVLASVLEQKNDYSDIILPLSVHSNTLTTFGGGPGTVGIHTWPDNSFLKQRNSDGCIRVTPEALDQLAKLPLGTIVDIVE